MPDRSRHRRAPWHFPFLACLLLLALSVPAAVGKPAGITLQRRMMVMIADFAVRDADVAGSTVAERLEEVFARTPGLQKGFMIAPRGEHAGKLAGLSPDAIAVVLKKVAGIPAEGVVLGEVIGGEKGWTIRAQVADIRRGKIPTSRRTLHYAEIADVSPEGLSVALEKLAVRLQEGRIPRVDVVTPNFDSVSITSVNKDNFPEVRLTISVTDRDGNPVSVPPDLFEVRQDGLLMAADVRRAGDVKVEQVPLNVVLVIDRSPSMEYEGTGSGKKKTGRPFRRAKAAALEFIEKLSERDRVMVIAFDYDCLELGPLSADKSIYRRKLDALTVGRGTGLYHALGYAVGRLEGVEGEKVVILLTDGKNDVTRARPEVKAATLDQGIDRARRMSVPVYTIGFAEADRKVLGGIAKETHSLFLAAASSTELARLYRKLHRIIENQYVITYRSHVFRGGQVAVDLRQRADAREYEISEQEISLAKARESSRIVREEREKLEAEREALAAEREAYERARREADAKLSDAGEAERKLTEMKARLDAREKEMGEKEAEQARLEKRLATLQKALRRKERLLGEQEANAARRDEDLATEARRLEEIEAILRRVSGQLTEAQRLLDEKLQERSSAASATNEP